MALLHALQIAPRVSWAQAARVLGSTATTLAHRWQRLREAGLAWVTAHPGRRSSTTTVAFLELDVSPAEREQVIAALCADPRAATVEEAAGGRDLLVTALLPDRDALTRFALDDLPRIGGVRRVDTRLATAMHWEGSLWRLDALDREQQARLREAVPVADVRPAVPLPDEYWPLVEALTADGRRSAADLARLTGRNPATVRRQVSRLLSSGVLSFRCEVAHLRSRWPVVCTWFAHVPPADLDRTVQSLVTLPELRLCASVSGDSNLMFTLWTASPAELVRVERLLSGKLPWLRLRESVLELRTRKRMGWVLDARGCSTGQVVVPGGPGLAADRHAQFRSA
nr:Lrp/AsnC family transcriptional regulator [Saccharopolyspora sp. HNM0983]